MIDYYSHTLPNGLRIVHKPTNNTVSYCGFIIDAGTRDEDGSQHGMAHFIEHMLFKGTKKRRSHHIINRIEHIGGELNAYTNKEETVVHAAFLEEHFPRVFELLADMVFNSQFPQREIEKEVEVIIDEIHSYEDSPSELIFDEFENLVFRDSQLGHNILGTPDALQSFDTNKAMDFASRYYNPSNMVFFSTGKTDFKRIIYLAEKYTPQIMIDKASVLSRQVPNQVERCKQEQSEDTTQTHAIIGFRVYGLYDSRRMTLNLLNNILGGPGMNSRLNTILREKKGYVYTVDSTIAAYTDSGVMSVYFGCDKRNANKCLELARKEIKRLRDTRLTEAQLSIAKRQIMGQIAVQSDNNENIALALGKNILRYNSFDTLEQIFKKIEAVTVSDILDAANELLDENRMFSLIYN